MLAHAGELPTGEGWAYEVKWDGFRAVVSTEDGLRVRSRRGWDMTDRLPELAELPAGLVLDGEIVAFDDGVPYFPDIVARVLHGDGSIAVRYAVFDLLRVDGHDLTCNAWSDRRAVLEELELPPLCLVGDAFDDGAALFQAVCDRGLEGVVAKRRSGRYRPGQRGTWVKVKNPGYWRRESEVEGFRRSHERRAKAAASASR
jgi:bifunctional non-homologous end joining protein LigD